MVAQTVFPKLCMADAFNLCSSQHCLLGWDILPPKSEKRSVSKSLDLWSAVSCGSQRRRLSATGPSFLVGSRLGKESIQGGWVLSRWGALQL